MRETRCVNSPTTLVVALFFFWLMLPDLLEYLLHLSLCVSSYILLFACKIVNISGLKGRLVLYELCYPLEIKTKS